MDRYGFLRSKLAKRGPKAISNRIRDSFICGFNRSGVSWLPRWLNINNNLVWPTFWYNGADAGASTWTAEYGSDLSIAGSGDDPTLNYGSPFQDSTDGVKCKGGKHYQASDASFIDITTEDFITEKLIWMPSVINKCLLDKVHTDSTGWTLYSSSGGATIRLNFRLLINGIGAVNIISGPIYSNIVHCMCFIDRSGYGLWYVNGSPSGSAVDISSMSGSLSNTGRNFTIGATAGGLNVFNEPIFQLALWDFGVGGLDTHAQDDLVKERFYRLCGIYPQLARGTALPTSYTRASSAVLYKYNSTTSAWEGWPVGDGWPRVDNPLDDNTFTGYWSEQQVDNDATYSHQLENLSQTNVTIAEDTGNASPIKGWNWRKATESTDGGNEYHYCYTDQVSFTAGEKRCAWILAKAGTRDYIKFDVNQTTTRFQVWFNVSNGTLGNESNNDDAGFIDLGDNTYICWMTFTASDTETKPVVVYIANSGESSSYQGNGGVSTYLMGLQCEVGTYPTSLIYTSGSVATREADVLIFKGDDGNLGGVGSNEQGQVEFDVLVPDHDNTTILGAFATNDAGSLNESINVREIASDAPVLYIKESSNIEAYITGSTAFSDGTKHSYKAKWKTNNVRQYIDGSEDGTADTSATIPDDQDRIYAGRDTQYELNGHIANLVIKPGS